MAIELPNGETSLGLAQYNRCYASALHPKMPLDEDHIIPKIAVGDHRKVFKDLRNADENRAHICKDCHKKIDGGRTGKIATYRAYGPVGLLDFIASRYTLPEDPEFRDIFLLQRRVLFMRIRQNLYDHKEKSKGVLSEYHMQILKTADMHIKWWEAGHITAPERLSNSLLANSQQPLALRSNLG